MTVSGDTPAWYLGFTPGSAQRWLTHLRWTTAAMQATVVAVVLLLPGLDLPLDHVAPFIAAAAVWNAVIAVWSTRGGAPRALVGVALAVDVVMLTGLLELSGGPFNPFTVIYIAQIALAAVTLGGWWATALSVCAGTGFGVLVYWHLNEQTPFHHRLNDLPTHLFTMWIAAVTTAELVAHFAAQASAAVAEREDALRAMRASAARTERLIALTTLAAGAAHELSTPLATIAVAARELERTTTTIATGEELADDARLIRQEVERCQAILDQMSGRAGGIASDHREAVDLDALMDDVRGRLSGDQAARLTVRVPAPAPPFLAPRAGLSQVLASLVRNAFDAGGPEAGVVLEVTTADDALRVAVHDQGAGMSAEVLSRAGEPFYTTKEPGRGLGLGLFLARIFAERLGGTLTLESGPGTTAVLELPRRAASAEAS